MKTEKTTATETKVEEKENVQTKALTISELLDTNEAKCINLNEKEHYNTRVMTSAPYFDVYGNADEIGPSGDLYDMMNNDEANPEVNQTKSVYTTQLNVDVQETFNMVLTSALNK